MNPANSNLVLVAADEARPEADKPDPVEHAFQDVLQYEQGGTRKAVAVLDNYINQTYGDAPARKQIVGRLLGMLENPEASPGCKNLASKKLMSLAGPESVPALAGLIGDDENLALLGRYALEQMPQPEAAAALRDALGRTKGRVLIGVINSWAARVALRRPAIPAQNAPPTIAAVRARGIRTIPGRSNEKPTQSAAMPTMSI